MLFETMVERREKIGRLLRRQPCGLERAAWFMAGMANGRCGAVVAVAAGQCVGGCGTRDRRRRGCRQCCRELNSSPGECSQPRGSSPDCRNAGGYRYRIGDEVECSGMRNEVGAQTPMPAFRGRAGNIAGLVGEKIEEAHRRRLHGGEGRFLRFGCDRESGTLCPRD